MVQTDLGSFNHQSSLFGGHSGYLYLTDGKPEGSVKSVCFTESHNSVTQETELGLVSRAFTLLCTVLYGFRKHLETSRTHGLQREMWRSLNYIDSSASTKARGI